MDRYKKTILVSIACAAAITAVSGWIFAGDAPIAPFLLLAGFAIVLAIPETKSYKFLDRLAAGSALFGVSAIVLISLRMYLLTQFHGDRVMPALYFGRDSLFMMWVFAGVSFAGGLMGIVVKGAYALYRERIDKLILFLAPVFLLIASLLVTKLKYGGTIMSELYGWPRPFLIRQVKDIIDGFLIDKWIFSPGSLYHYIIEDYLFYFAVLSVAWFSVRALNRIVSKKLNATLVVFGLAIAIAVSLSSFKTVNRSYIEREIAKAGYCEADADCVIAGSKCPFSCAITVNKAEVGRIMGLVDSFDSDCVYGCIECKTAVCRDKKCQPVCD